MTAAETSDPRPPHLEVLYRDDALLIVNKPAGLLVHNGWAKERYTALTAARALAGTKVYPVHRLDRATSGVLVFALSSAFTRSMQARLTSEQAEKRYLALVRGITPEAGEIDHAIAKKRDGEKRPAKTLYWRWGSFERYSLVEARPLTGRLHQIRRHFKHISHPLIGDVRYGKGEHNRLFRERFALHRLVLHAHFLRFEHPSSGEELVIRAPLPQELAAPLSQMDLLEVCREHGALVAPAATDTATSATDVGEQPK